MITQNRFELRGVLEQRVERTRGKFLEGFVCGCKQGEWALAGEGVGESRGLDAGNLCSEIARRNGGVDNIFRWA